MTPSTTQQSSFMSQPSFTSLQTAPDEETLSTPRLTQATSVGIVPPDPPSLPASQEPPKLEEIPNAEEKSSIVEERPATPQKAPNLIEKLKAMRKLSSQSPRRTRDTSATSPWFAPKRSSQGLPDNKAESEVESLPEKEQSTQQTAASTGQTPKSKNSFSFFHTLYTSADNRCLLARVPTPFAAATTGLPHQSLIFRSTRNSSSTLHHHSRCPRHRHLQHSCDPRNLWAERLQPNNLHHRPLIFQAPASHNKSTDISVI